MSLVTIVWSMVASACLTLAVVHLLVWCRKRTAWADLLFFLSAAATVVMAFWELRVMRAQTPEQMATQLRWFHVPVWVVVVSLVGFVRVQLRAGRLWLAWTVVVFRTLSLLLNLMLPRNLNYREVAGPAHIAFLGESISVLEGTPSPWALVGHLSLLLFLAYVVDAAVTIWRRGGGRKGLVTCGSIAIFVLAAIAQAVLVNWRVVRTPLTFSLFFLGVVAVMAWEMSCETIRAAQLSADLAEQARFGALLSELSSEFVNISADKVNHQIEDAQRRICECLGLDLSALWQRSATSPCDLVLTHAYSPPDFPRPSEPLRASEAFPWCLQQVLAGKVLAVSSTAEAPAEAARDKETWRQLGIKATLTAPLSTGPGPIIGALSVLVTRAERPWPEAIVKRFQLVAQVFANAVARARADEALRESEARLHLATEAAGTGLWVMDPDGSSVWASAKTREFFQFDADEPLVYQDFIQRIHPDDRSTVDRAVQKAISAGQGFVVEYRVLRPDGQTRWIVARGSLSGPPGGPRHCMGASVDVTERKQSELEIQRHRSELAHMARVSTVSQLAVSLAHELNQPLGAILRNTETAELLLQDPLPDMDEVKAILEDIRKDDQRAGAVIDRMRAMMKRREIERCRLDLGALVNEVVALVRPDAERRHVRLAMRTDAALPLVQGDRVQLQQVLLNLLANAMDAVDDSRAPVRTVTVRVRPAAGTVEVTVSDTGRGIPADRLPRVFEPFFTSKPNGLGMGLAISRDIVVAHGGRLWAENNTAGGATFTFTLPVAEGGDST